MIDHHKRLFARRGIAAMAALVVPAIPLAALAQSQAQPGAPAGKAKVVFQVSDNDPAKWGLALNNIRNIQLDLGEDEVEIELVAYGPGLAMLKGGSPMAERVTKTLKTGVKVVACENTMKAQKLVYADMLTDIGYVPAGVVELVQKQRQGWAYIRP